MIQTNIKIKTLLEYMLCKRQETENDGAQFNSQAIVAFSV